MTETMVSSLEVTPPGLSRLWPQLVAQSGDGRGDTSPTALPGTDTMNAGRKTHVESPHLLHVSEPSSGPLTSKSPTSTSTSLSRTRGLVGRLHDCRPSHRGNRRCNDSIFSPSSLGKMRCSGYDICHDTTSTTGVTSVGGSLPTSSPSLTSRRSHGTSNPSGARVMKHFGHTLRGFRQ
jgi:hypothetical protein